MYKKLKRKNSSDNQTKPNQTNPISVCAVCMSHKFFFEQKQKKKKKENLRKYVVEKRNGKGNLLFAANKISLICTKI